MNIKIVLAIIGFLAVGAGATVFVTQKNSDVDAMRGDDDQKEMSKDQKGMGTLASLFGRGDDISCTVSYSAEGYSTEGVMFISGGKMRGDFTVQAGGQKMESHIIQDGTYGYSWGFTPMGDMGMKFAIGRESDEMSEPQSEEVTRYGIDLSQSAEYECEPWRVDESKFVPPSDIEFMDIEAQLKASTGSGSSQCGMCAQIPDADAKAQCLTALSCN